MCSSDLDGHGHFHPSLAGVANSIDFYPRPHTSHEHGCAQLSLGLGAAVVGGHLRRFDCQPRLLCGDHVL